VQPRTEYAPFDIQVHTVDYMNYDSLKFALRGIDLVISTVSGTEQLNLIRAAGEGSVRRFVPSEFEGKLSATGRSSRDDPLRPNSMSSHAFQLLRHFEQARRMKYTVFSCGILMETFHSHGLSLFNMGASLGVSSPGDFILNINTATATYTHRNANGRRVHICLTSAYDLGRFIVAALDLGPSHWPSEYTLRGDRLTLEGLVETCGQLQNGKCNPPVEAAIKMEADVRCLTVQYTNHRCEIQDLPGFIDYATQSGNVEQATYYRRLLATANGRYDFNTASLNERIAASASVNFTPMTFEQWLGRVLYPTPPE
jgi:hypothetical protein